MLIYLGDVQIGSSDTVVHTDKAYEADGVLFNFEAFTDAPTMSPEYERFCWEMLRPHQKDLMIFERGTAVDVHLDDWEQKPGDFGPGSSDGNLYVSRVVFQIMGEKFTPGD